MNSEGTASLGHLACSGRQRTNTQALNQILVSFRITASQIFQQAAPASNHQQQSTAGMMVLFMRLEMFAELQNTLAQDSNLNL